MIKLNLGCGNDVWEGWENYDKYPCDDRVNFIDLEKLPLPWDDSSIDEINLGQILEHLWVNPYSFMMEIHRILVIGGYVSVELPFLAVSSIEHIRGFHRRNYFDAILDIDHGSVHGQFKPFFSLVSFDRLFFRGPVFPFIRVHHKWILRKV